MSKKNKKEKATKQDQESKKQEETVVNEDVNETVETEEETVEETKEETEKDLIESLTNEVEELKNTMLRERADLENTKKRLEKERVTERKYAAMNVCKKLITPIDHFDMALKHEIEDEETDNFVKGFQMIRNELYNVLKDEGVSEIDALHEEYDPKFHQAIQTEHVDGTEANIVIEVIQKGYMFKERVIRPAIVKISE